MTVTVHIERVVLDAAAARSMSADQLAGSIQRELGARIAAEGLPAMLQSSSMVPGVPGGPRPRQARAAAGVGDALYGGLDR